MFRSNELVKPRHATVLTEIIFPGVTPRTDDDERCFRGDRLNDNEFSKMQNK